MKKCIKIVLFTFIILISLLSISSFSATPDLKSIDVNSLNLDSIPKNKVEDLKQALNNINVNELDSAAILDNIDKNEITSGNIDVNSIDTNNINMDEVVGIYKDLSKIISNKDIANLIKDNTEVLTEAGISKEALSASETILRTFDSDAALDIIQNDLDINKLFEMYKNGSSFEDIISSVITNTSIQTKISIISKLLFANFYVRLLFLILIFLGIYSIFITGIIFKKAGKKSFATFIPIYRDILHLKICHLSPWLLILVFIPILGWLALASVAIIGRFELSRSFGHGFFFGLGLLFLPPIFRTIIAFSSNEYIGDDPEEDEDD